MATRNLTVLLILFSALSSQLKAQQTPNYNLIRSDLSLINPANIDADIFKFNFSTKVSAVHLHTWTGVEGAPRTSSVFGEKYISPPIGRSMGLLFGGGVTSDRAGRIEQNSINLRYATVYSPEIDYSAISIGTNVNIGRYRINTDDLSAAGVSTIAGYLDETTKATIPSLGFGVFAYKRLGHRRVYQRNYSTIYGGFSIPSLVSFAKESAKSVFATSLSYYAIMGFIKSLGDESSVEFSNWTKYEKTGIWVSDLRVTYNFSNKTNLSFGYNTSNLVTFGAEFFTFNYKESLRWKFGYSGQFALARGIVNNYGIQHELGVSIAFGEL